jgi:hypothetical protein
MQLLASCAKTRMSARRLDFPRKAIKSTRETAKEEEEEAAEEEASRLRSSRRPPRRRRRRPHLLLRLGIWLELRLGRLG